jgi:hypothetical protein
MPMITVHLRFPMKMFMMLNEQENTSKAGIFYERGSYIYMYERVLVATRPS